MLVMCRAIKLHLMPVGWGSPVTGTFRTGPTYAAPAGRQGSHRGDARYIKKITVRRSSTLIVGEFGYLLVGVEYGNSTYSLSSYLHYKKGIIFFR